MCTRGVFQLRKLSVYFCDFGGSSAGVRKVLMSPQLKEFMTANEHIEFNFIVKRNYHPFVTGAYINGYLKDIPLRSLEPE
jgi:large subunit ribosomal protein L43